MHSNPSNNELKPNQDKVQHQPSEKKDKKITIISLSVLLAAAIGSFGITALIQHFVSTPDPEPQQSADQPIPDPSVNLDYAFFNYETSKQNLIYSPLSIKNGLALLYAGAAGNTKTQIENVLGDVTILGKTTNIADKFSLANAVFVRDTFEKSILPSYTEKAEKSYGAEIISDDFLNSNKIDNWVSQKTFGLINNLDMEIDKETKMVLINALAIQLDWLHQFDTSDTAGDTFTNEDGEEMTVTTMTQITHADDIRYYFDQDVTLLTMPLEKAGDAELEFIAIMPTTGNLSSYLKSFTPSDIESKLALSTAANALEVGAEIHIPRFKFDYELDFKKDLISLGVVDVFDPTLADFSNMATSSLFVSDAVHKANIDFSEKGIKAAAVTAFGMKVTSVMAPDDSQPIVVQINKPFLFLIRDKNNHATWFTGTVYKPNLWSDDLDFYRPQ